MVIFYTWQRLVARFVLVFIRTFVQLEVFGVENLSKVERPYLLTANHKSMIDAFLIGAIIVTTKISLGPLRFMAKDRLFWYPLLNLFLWSFGAFRARKKQGLEKTLETPIRILRSGGALVVFPEAHIVPNLIRLGEGRRGAAVLAYTTGAPVLPVSFFVDRPLSLGNLISRTSRIVVRIGEPYSLGPANPDVTEKALEAATGTIMGRIRELFEKDLSALRSSIRSDTIKPNGPNGRNTKRHKIFARARSLPRSQSD